MKINISKAAKHFFSTSSLEQVYFEAVANSIDAQADKIEINIFIDSFTKLETFRIEIIDNGIGFTDKNFEIFAKLLETDAEDHKGFGRLVFLYYFDSVKISSVYDNNKRTFTFNENWDEKSKIADVKDEERKTILEFTDYKLKKIKEYDYLRPVSIKQSLLLHFFPLFYKLKLDKKELRIKIKLQTREPDVAYKFHSDIQEIIISQIPDLELEVLNAEYLDAFEKLNLFYSVKATNPEQQSIVTAICVDNRTFAIPILKKENIPFGYEIIFILYSNLFQGKVNLSRQELEMDEVFLRTTKKIFSNKVAEILNKKIPKIQERNKEVNEGLEDRFPHLQGYFDENPVGLIDRTESLRDAQEKFFVAQKEILDAEQLSEEQYQKSLDISSRILMEYILYRNLIINKLKKIDPKSDEAEIHNIIVPMRRTFKKANFINDIYTNNAWLLDDKYMSYSSILSDKEMDELIKNISLDEEIINEDDSRPDIAIVFSNKLKPEQKVDVIIVELKKLKLPLAKREEVESQLRQRAKKLLEYYPNKIQRIWFYGIVDIDKEFRVSLKEKDYTELYSEGTVMYKEQKIILDEEKDIKIPVGIFIISFDTFIKDAESRNSTFLNLLKEGMKNKIEKNK